MIAVVLFIISNAQYALCLNGRGLTPLDSASFEKITSKFKATLIKFDIYFPFGPAHDEFVKFAGSAINESDFLVAEVGVKDYGDFAGQDLLERFRVDKEHLPVIKLFFSDGRSTLQYSGDVSATALARWVRRVAGWPLPGALADFDRLAETLTSAADEVKRRRALGQAEELLRQCESGEAVPRRREQARYYVRVMERAVKDARFVESELRRLEGLLDGRLSEEKRRTMEARLNALLSFVPKQQETGTNREEL